VGFHRSWSTATWYCSRCSGLKPASEIHVLRREQKEVEHAKKILSKILLVALVSSLALAQTAWPKTVTELKLHTARNQIVSISGKLENGILMPELDWASTSSMACFPATENAKFQAKHVMYATIIPTRSTMIIKVIPKDPNVDLSLWAYSIGTTDFSTPPKVPRSVSCEYDAKWDRAWANKTQDHTRSVELRAVNNSYNILIGVSGPASTASAEFDLEVLVK
jgi:hypothetical protein